MTFCGDWFSDNAIMYDVLASLYLTTGNDRAGSKIFIKNGSRSVKPQSCKFGTTWRCMIGSKKRTYSEKEKGYLTKLKEEEPELDNIFREFSSLHFPDFKWTDITINYMPESTCMKLHTDKVNVGDSILCAFGDYEGGYTFVKNIKDRNYSMYDCRTEWIKFNGAERKHFVSTVQKGDRFSLVFYNSKSKF
jgi:hypothetical protein